MDRRLLLKQMGVVSLVGGLAGCSGGSGEDTNNGPSEDTEASFSGNWGLPACSDNEDARVVIQDYSPEQGVGQIYNRTNTNLYVSVMNEAGSTAESNQGDYDIYVPFGESEPFRLSGTLESVITMTESKYERRDSVNWINRHDSQENQGCTLPEGDSPTPVEIEPTEEDLTEDRIKDNVEDAAGDDDTTTYDRDDGSSSDDAGSNTTEEGSSGLVGSIQEAGKASTGVQVIFSVESGLNAPDSVPYTLRVLTQSDASYPQSGSISLERNGTVSKEVLIEFSEFDESTEYAVELILDGSFQDVRVVN